MGLTLSEKLITSHLTAGEMKTGAEIGIRIDQTLTQDATGTMAYLEFEALGAKRVKTELSVAYIDHNTLQTGFENADDHAFIQSVAKKRGVLFSRPGNGICHQVHLERFGIPGKTLIGSDSHTPTAGGIGMLSFGAGGLDVAVAMGGGPYYINMPKIVLVKLTGSLSPWVSAKDVILQIIGSMSVKGGVGRILEYGGDGVKALSIPERATITNMGTELGATTSVFPSDETTRKFLEMQGRGKDFVAVSADADAVYDEVIEIDLNRVVPLAAMPHMPDMVNPVTEIGRIKIDQVCIGSCTNSSLLDMMKVAAVLKNRKIHPDVSLTISPGSMQVLSMLSANGALSDIIAAGARVLEAACGPCIGMGQSPKSSGVSLRTFNRNFEGRSGTPDAGIYLVSPEVAAASALTGVLTDPRDLGKAPSVIIPKSFAINDNLIEKPAAESEAGSVDIYYGPNIKPFPNGEALPDEMRVKTVIKVGDNITTDHIMPAGAKILPYRSNIPYLSRFCFRQIDENFAERAKAAGRGLIIAGSNYGQGSSREHAALVPLYLGIRVVAAKSFARIHAANLINAGITPFTFANEKDFDKAEQDDEVLIPDIRNRIADGDRVIMMNMTKNESYILDYNFTERQKQILLSGGLLNYTKTNENR